MTIYSSSRKLKIDSDVNVKLLTSANIEQVTEDDIVIGTGTIRDELIVKNLVDRAVLPFIVTFSLASTFSPFLENLSLIVQQKITQITPELLDEIENIRTSIERFETYAKAFLEKERNLKELTSLALLQQMQLLNHLYKDGFKSDDKERKRRDIYTALSHRGKKAFYLTLHSDDMLRVFKIEQELNAKEQEFVSNMFRNHFESVMQGEKIELRNRHYAFEYQEITQGLNQDFLLIGIDSENDFSSYGLYDIKTPKAVEKMSLYEVGSEIQEIDEKGQSALESLRNIIQYNSVDSYQNLDIFLFSARHFKSIIASIEYHQQESFKRSIISDIFEKIYENITKKDRATSLLRFALVSLLSDKFSTFNLNTHSHIFYDIHNGVNINAQLLKGVAQDTIEPNSQKKTLNESETIDREQQELLDTFLEQNQNQKFIEIFLKSLLNMDSNKQLNGEKTVQFVAMTAYLSSNENAKTAYCFTTMIFYQSTSNLNHFFLKLDEFVYLEEHITIEEYLKKELPYQCQEGSKEVKVTIGEEKFIKTKVWLRQFKHRFSLQLLKVGNFYRLISKALTIEDIIVISFQKIRDRELKSTELCQNSITFQFLAIFFKGHGKKNCQSNLESFLEEGQILLEEY